MQEPPVMTDQPMVLAGTNAAEHAIEHSKPPLVLDFVTACKCVQWL